MKLLKWRLALLVVLGVVLVGGGGLLLPTNNHLERSITIERPPAEVFATLPLTRSRVSTNGRRG